MNSSERLSLQGKLGFKVGSGRGIVLNTMYNKNNYRDYDHRFKLNPDGDYKRFNVSYLASLAYTHVFSNAVFLDLLGSGIYTEYNQYVYEDPLDPRYVNPDRMSDVSGAAFLSGGTQNWHFNHKTETYTGKIDLTAQIDQVNQIKAGGEYQYHHLRYKDFQTIVDATSNFKPALPNQGAFNYNTYETYPYQAALYVQDKVELDYLIINIGVRADYFNPNGKVLKDPNNIAVLDEMLPPFPDSLFTDATDKFQVSPRIGISYPMSDYGAIHVSYGHFFQVPPFEYLYQNPNFRIPLTGNFPANIGNTIGNADLKPQQTVMYEIGLQQAITDQIGITITAYQKDIRNLLCNRNLY